MVHPDEATAIERGIDGAHFFGYSLAHYYVFGEHHPGRTDVYQEFLERRDETGFARSIVTPDQAPLGIKILQQGLGSLRGAVGTPEQVRELVSRYEAAGVDQLIFVLQAGRNRHEHICEAIELFGNEVLPEFAARADESDRAVDEKLADAIQAAMARRAPARESDPAYTIETAASGPPPAKVGAGAHGVASANGRASLGDALRSEVMDRGDAAFAAFVRRSDDRRLERFAGSGPGLRLLFGGMAQRFVPEKANGFSGELQYELKTTSGKTRRWTVEIRGDKAIARPGGAKDPRLTVRASLPDFLRIAARELEPGAALLTGRLDVAGDFEVAARLGEMFGQPAAL
jgi:putative sterol carrier protein